MATTANKATKTTTAKSAEAKKSAVAQTAKKEETFTKDELDAIVAKAVAEALSRVQTAPAVQGNEMVSVIFLGCIAKGTSVKLGKLGVINREGIVYEYPKKEFARCINTTIDQLITERKLIIVDGLTDAEREQYNAVYGEDELLTAETYRKLLTYDVDKLAAIFTKLCTEHRQMVAKMFYSAYTDSNDSRVTLDKCRRLNEICKDKGEDSLFSNLIQFMGGKLAD